MGLREIQKAFFWCWINQRMHSWRSECYVKGDSNIWNDTENKPNTIGRYHCRKNLNTVTILFCGCSPFCSVSAALPSTCLIGFNLPVCLFILPSPVPVTCRLFPVPGFLWWTQTDLTHSLLCPTCRLPLNLRAPSASCSASAWLLGCGTPVSPSPSPLYPPVKDAFG